jgi:hypothetical protein
MSKHQRRGAGESAPAEPAFEPVKLRHRHDGLTPPRQIALIRALAACGCVREACARVGVSTEAVYRLRRRPDAQSFRLAMDMALDGGADRVEDAMFARAIDGVEIPHYYKGELVGTHRRYDERLAMFILRYRKPSRYGRHLDKGHAVSHPERSALGMAGLMRWVEEDAWRDFGGHRRTLAKELGEEAGESWNEDGLHDWGPTGAGWQAAALAAAGGFGGREEAGDDARDWEWDVPNEFYPPEPCPCSACRPPAPPMPPDGASTSSTSAAPANRRTRRAAGARTRKR